ncbi:MAG: VRR-NUC domain-containing protein [Verrucomicrobiales bacterium]
MIPNGAARATNARHLVAQGLAAGIPDLVLLVPSGAFGGLFIELKRRSGGKLSPEQCDWIARLRVQGYRAEVCAGWEVAREVILEYLHGGTWTELPLDRRGI